MKKFIAILLITALCALPVTGCSKKQPVPEPPAAETVPDDITSSEEAAPQKPTASEAAAHNSAIRPEDVRLIQFDEALPGESAALISTSEGNIKVRLFKTQAPQTVAVFEQLAKDGYYNGQRFDTIVGGYKIEGGGKHDDDKFPGGEFSLELWNFRGAVSLANNGTDFMIIDANQCLNPVSELEELNFPAEVIAKYAEVGGAPHQDWENTVFGQVVEGMDVVDKIASSKTGADGIPEEPVIITSIEITAA